MTNNAETIERLARDLERHKILDDLKSCKSMSDIQELIKKYEALCANS
ncbi:MAG: hypothetical protein NC078_06860 [Ruminococcus sp.]|nr:hypothetical protein [Ruminococcus sp.]